RPSARRAFREAQAARGTPMNPIELFLQTDMSTSARLMIAADGLCCVGAATAIAAGFLRWRAVRAEQPVSGASRIFAAAPFAFLVAAVATMLGVVPAGWNGVNPV